MSIDGRCIRDVIDRVSSLLHNYLLVIKFLFLCFELAANWKQGILISLEYLPNRIVFRVTEMIDNDIILRLGELTDYLRNIHTIHSYNMEDGV